MESGLFDLYEIENGQLTLTGPSKKLLTRQRKPVTDYFAAQNRFKSLDVEHIKQLQHQIDAKWQEYSSNFSPLTG